MNIEIIPDFVQKCASLHCNVQDILPEEIRWNRDVTDVKDFIDWFIKYVDDSNSLNSRELRE